MSAQPTIIAPDEEKKPLDSYAVTHRRAADWRRLLPGHRMPVVVKTPLMIALGVSLSGGAFDGRTVGVTMLLASALWTVLYALNEATDLTNEQDMTVARPVMAALYALPIVITLVAARFFLPLALPFALMTASQFAYCVPPVRLKRQWWAIILLSGTLNPILRLQCGVVWGHHALHTAAYAAFVCGHLGAAFRARALLRERDRRFGYTVAPAGSETVGMICTTLGFVGAYWMCWRGDLPPLFAIFVTLAAGFAVYAWSGRVTNVARLRRGWLWFALLSGFALAVLFARR